MKKLPRWPRGLKARLARAERKFNREKEIAARKKEIDDAKKQLKNLLAGKPKKSKS